MRYVWDPFVRLFHWSLVIAFTIAFYTHASEWERVTHTNAGYVAGFLLIARVIWGLGKTGYASFQAFPFRPIAAFQYAFQVFKGSAKPTIGHNPAGSLVIYLMLFTGLLTAVSGFLVFNDGWIFESEELLQDTHLYSAWAWLGLIVMHVLGVITESILHKDNLILAMLTGVKRHVDESQLDTNDQSVSRETLQAFARWTLGLRAVCKSYMTFNRANKTLYSIIEENELVDKYGVEHQTTETVEPKADNQAKQ